MQQSNTLRRLELILESAIENGDRNKAAGPIILEAMGLVKEPQNLIDFYEILNKAKEEVRGLKSQPKIFKYFQTLEELYSTFIYQHLWSAKWDVFASYIETRCILLMLDALANYKYDEDPNVFLERDFLEQLNNEFQTLSNTILESDLSKELKKILVEQVDKILRAIRRYYLDGTEGLREVAKSIVGELTIVEPQFKEEDRKHPVTKNVAGWVLSLLLYFAPSPYDVIGAVPDVYDFWIPQFEELRKGQARITKIIAEASTIQEAFEMARHTFDCKEAQKSITGTKEPKALPPSKDDNPSL